jgi:hypothetical protein
VNSPRKCSWSTPLWIGLVLPALAAAAISLSHPLFNCPSCEGTGVGGYSSTFSDDRVSGPTTIACFRCGETGRVTLQEKCHWSFDRNLKRLKANW